MRLAKRLREDRRWSAEQLAAAMAKAGVPWTRDTVVNLETGRRKRIAAHELLALAYVLDIAPVVLISGLDDLGMVPVTPNLAVTALEARDWMFGFTALSGTDEERYVANLPAISQETYSLKNVDDQLAAVDALRTEILARRTLAERRQQALRPRRPEGEDADGKD